jgi:Aminotransferase class-III
MRYNIVDLFEARERDRFALHSRHLNEQMVRVLRAIGYDVGFCRGEGQYLYDREGTRYLDLLSGFGVFAVGRNHPTLREALKNILDSQLPNLVQMDVSTLAAILAERLLVRVPYLSAVHAALGGAAGLLGRIGRLDLDLVARRDLLDLFEPHLIFGQRLSAPAKTMALQFLDDLTEPFVLYTLGNQHRL